MDNGPIEIVQFARLFELLGDGWVALVVIGVFAGFIVRMTTTRRKTIGFWSTSLLGVAGAWLGITAARALELPMAGVGARFLAALVGGFALAMLGGIFRRKDRPPADAPPRRS